MTHHISPEVDSRPGRGHTDSARASAIEDAFLDHHIEELLGALGDLDLSRPGGPVARAARET